MLNKLHTQLHKRKKWEFLKHFSTFDFNTPNLYHIPFLETNDTKNVLRKETIALLCLCIYAIIQ